MFNSFNSLKLVFSKILILDILFLYKFNFSSFTNSIFSNKSIFSISFSAKFKTFNILKLAFSNPLRVFILLCSKFNISNFSYLKFSNISKFDILLFDKFNSFSCLNSNLLKQFKFSFLKFF